MVGDREQTLRWQGFRMLSVDEITDCFMEAFKRDTNGSVYIVTPGSSYVEVPNIENRSVDYYNDCKWLLSRIQHRKRRKTKL